MKVNLLSCIILTFFISLSACHRQRQKSQTQSPTDSVAVVQADTLVPPKIDTLAITKPNSEAEEIKVNVENVDFQYLSAKSKISFKSKDQDIDNANVTMRMRKDSVLWLQIVAGPIEVVRGLITRDSIQIIDRYNKTYYQYDFVSLSQKFNFQLNFDLIQSILIGNMPIPKKSGERFRKEKDYFMLRQDEGKISLENYIGEQNRRLKKLLVTEFPTKNSLTLDYEDFTQLNNYLFPYTSLIQLDYESKQLLTFPFSIPPKYQKK
jgi:Domain of unknown function (DUF4292)